MIASRSAAFRLLAVAFSLGALVGGAATMLAERGSHSRGPHQGGRQQYVSRLASEVGLSADQEREAAAVLERHEPVMDSIWNQVRQQFDTERQAVRRDIRALLTPDQVAKYDAMLARKDSVRREKESKHGNR